MTANEQDIDALPEAELQVLPASAIPAGGLANFLSRRSIATQKENAEELVRELTGATRSRRMLGAGRNPDEREKEQERRQEAYVQALREIRERQDRLLQRIAIEEERLSRQRLEIEGNAIKLADGRRVYVDGQKYRDEQGRELDGDDQAEAARKHRDHPQASTWQEKTEVERRLAETRRIRLEVEAQRDRHTDGIEDRVQADRTALDRYEREFAKEVEARNAAIEKQADPGDRYGGDYSAYTGTASSHAATLDGRKEKALSATFMPAAIGERTKDLERINTPAPVPSLTA